MQRKQPVFIQNSLIFLVHAGHTVTLLERRHWVVAFHQLSHSCKTIKELLLSFSPIISYLTPIKLCSLTSLNVVGVCLRYSVVAVASPGRWASHAVVLGRLIVPSSQREALKTLDGNCFPQETSVMETEDI